MKLHILYDAKGRILAAVDLTAETEGTPAIRPVPGRGQKSVELEVPSEHRDLDFLTACQSLRVDVRSGKLVASNKTASKKQLPSPKN